MGKARSFSSKEDEAVYQTESDNENYANSTHQNPQGIGNGVFDDQSGYGNFSQSGRDQRNASLDGSLFRGNIGFNLDIGLLDVSTNTLNILEDGSGNPLSVVSVDHIVALSSGTTANLITILGSQRPGQRLVLYGIFGNTITLIHTAGAIENTIRCPGNVNFILQDTAVVELVFDITTAQWRIVGVSSTGGGGTTFPILYPKEDLTPPIDGIATINIALNTGNAKQIQFPASNIEFAITGDPASSEGEDVYVLFIQDDVGSRILDPIDSRINNGSLMNSLLDPDPDSKTLFRLATLDGGVTYFVILVDLSTAAGGLLSTLAIDVNKDWNAKSINNFGGLTFLPFLGISSSIIPFATGLEIQAGDTKSIKFLEDPTTTLAEISITSLQMSVNIDANTNDILGVDRLQMSGGTPFATSVNDVVWYLDTNGNLVSNVNASDGWIWSSGNVVKMILTDSTLQKLNVTAPVFELYNTIAAQVGTAGNMNFLANSENTATGVIMSSIIGDTEVFVGDGRGSLKLNVNLNGTLTSFLTLNEGNDEQVDMLRDVDMNTFDITSIDRLRFAVSSGSVTSDDDPSILLDGNSNMLFNIAEQDEFIWAASNQIIMRLDEDGTNNDTRLTIQTVALDASAIPQLLLNRIDPTPENDTDISLIQFQGSNAAVSGGVKIDPHLYAEIKVEYENVVDGREASSMAFITSFDTGDATQFLAFMGINLQNSGTVDMLRDVDMSTFDVTNIDRLRFTSDSGGVTSDDDPSIFLDGNSNMVFNLADQKQFFWTMNNRTRMQLDQAGTNNDTILTVETDFEDSSAIPFFNLFRDDPTPESGLGVDSEITKIQFIGRHADTNGGAAVGDASVYSQIITTYESVITNREASSVNFFTSFDTGTTTQLKSFLGLNNGNSERINAFVNLSVNDHGLIFAEASVPADAEIDDSEGIVFFDDSTDPPILKIKKKSSISVVSVVSLEGAGGGISFPIRYTVTTGLPTTGNIQLNLNQTSGHYFTIGPLTGNIDIDITNPPTVNIAQAFRINIIKGATDFTVTFNDTLLVQPFIGVENTTTLLAGDIYDGTVFNIFTMTSTAGSGAPVENWANFPAVSDIDFATFDGINVDRLIFSQSAGEILTSNIVGITSDVSGNFLTNAVGEYQWLVDANLVMALNASQLTMSSNIDMSNNSLFDAITVDFNISNIFNPTTLTIIGFDSFSLGLKYNSGATTTNHQFEIGGEPMVFISRLGASRGALTTKQLIAEELIDLATFTNSSPTNGNIWLDLTSGLFQFRQNNATVGLTGSPLTTKGDLYGFSTVDARIPVGSDGQVLTADSTDALGVSWQVAAGGGDVSGPGATVTANSIARWNGTSGTDIADSDITINPAGQFNNITRINQVGSVPTSGFINMLNSQGLVWLGAGGNPNGTLTYDASGFFTFSGDVGSSVIGSNGQSLGTSGSRWGTLNAVAVDLTGSLQVEGNTNLNGDTNIGNEATDTLSISAVIDSDLIPSGTRDLGNVTNQWQDIYIDGNANIDTLTNSVSIAVTADLDLDFNNTIDWNQTASSASSSTQTLPANPEGFLVIKVNGASKRVPFYPV